MNPKSKIDLIQERIRDLRENTDFVATLFESLTGYAIIAADFDGNIIAYNEGARQIYGYTPEEVIAKQNIDIFFPKDFIGAGGLQQIIDDLIRKGRCSHEGEKVRKNGERFPVQSLFTVTKDKNGKVVGFVEIVEDLTERKRAEEAATLLAEEKAAYVERLEEELRSLARISQPSQTGVTGRMYGVVTLRDGFSDAFSELVRSYEELMDLALEQQAYKVKHDISGRLGSMAETLGFYKAGPRDVVDIHTSALKEKSLKAATVEKRKAYTGEGWIMVLELMGHLASFYRNRTQGASAPTNPKHKKIKEDRNKKEKEDE
jgi:PAS domain S-box-containing protein